MRSAGYTLVELLIAIAITSIFSLVGFVSYKNFSDDQIIKKATDEVQTIIRVAQTNGSTGVFCNDLSSLAWSIQFVNNKTDEIKLYCEIADGTIFEKDTLLLKGTDINDIKADGCPSSSYPADSFTIRFRSGATNMEFIGTQECLKNSPQITIKVKDTKSEVIKNIFVSKGGTVNVKN